MDIVRIDKIFPHQPPEIDDGNREYKLKLHNYSKIHKIASQLRYRLYEGDGKALYILGVSDSGKSWGVEFNDLNKSLKYLQQACSDLSRDSGEIVEINKIRVYQGICPDYFIATVRVVKN